MDESMPSLVAETEVVRNVYAALNRSDIPAMVQAFDPQIVWTDPDNVPGAGTYRGIAEVEALLVRARGTWAEGSCEPQEFRVVGDNVVVFLHVRVRLKDATDWIEGDMVDVWTFRKGKIVRGHSFPDRRRALEWAGVKTSDAD